MTVASTTNRVDYTGNGSTTVFSFTFRIFEAADLVVTTADANGVETTLVLDTDYTVTGAGSYSGGSVTISPALASGVALTLQRVLDITQETDLRNQGQFFAETHEDVFDRMVMIGQQLQEQIDRSAKLPVTNTTDADDLTADIVLLADNLATLDTIADAITDIQTVADDLNEGTSEIETVAGAIDNVNAVGANISSVNAVASNETNIDTVAGINGNVTTVAGIAANVTTVGGISSNVTTVAGIAANVTTVAGIAAAVSTVAANNTDVSTVAANIADVNTVADDIADINTCADNMAAILDAPAQASAAAASAAAAAASLDNFDDRYLGAKNSAPSVDNDGNALVAGALYFNTGVSVADDKGMWIYDGGTWIQASAASQAILVRYKYVATAAQTTFTGADANGLTLSYTAGSIIVTLNGVVMDAADYTATSGNSVVLASGAAASDEVCVFAFSTFDIANTYTQAQVDTLLAAKASKAGDTFTGDVALDKAGTGATLLIRNTSDSNRGFIARTASGKVQVGTNSGVYDLEFVIDSNAKAKIDTAFQRHSVIPSGSTLYPAYDCRAWVNFNGQGTVAIRGSGNVSSITDSAVGNYVVNFTTSMPDGNYSAVASTWRASTWVDGGVGVYNYNTSNVSVQNMEAQVGVDTSYFSVAVFR